MPDNSSKNNLDDDFGVIINRFDIAPTPELDEETLINALAGRIAEMLDHEMDLLLSTLYRLDVLEKNILRVLRSPVDPARGLAKLVVERQKEKIETRKKYGGE